MMRVNVAMTYHSTGMTYDFFVEKAVELQKHMIPTEQLEEMQGIADGLTAAGVKTSLNEVIGWNANTDITGYWWPTVHSQYGAPLSNPGAAMTVKGRCSAFVATGSATTNGKIVIGHQTFTEFYAGQFANVILDITPRSGHRLVFQAIPGLISSMTDFWVTGAGLSIVETTIVNFVGYNVSGSPEWIRARKASQYASSIDEWVSMMHEDNNGGYANSWLLADIHSNEIAIFELGLRYINYEKKTDGFFYGFNAPWDARIRNLECFDTGFNDVRQQTGARRVRWGQLFDQYNGAIDAKIGQMMLGDTYDVYLNKENPSSRTICSHYEVDPQYYVSDPNGVYNVPYAPFGSVDGKLTTADLARDMSMWGVFGRADGKEFNADSFLKEHPQWNWQQGYLQSRPAQPWTLFPGTK
eukprot:TRINITY_DN1279_c0_g1_i1.p1 TRINITY_DN1279_c0_g1~~TRINITY_DN1279_c0_g1_i1.p1  ORF type:complete len:411 (+),score=109.22 TRINITY_DN1279_c0_g1_i1:236-1468(+)